MENLATLNEAMIWHLGELGVGKLSKHLTNSSFVICSTHAGVPKIKDFQKSESLNFNKIFL